MYAGVVYDAAHPPSDKRYQLDAGSLASLAAQLVDAPVRIEHTSQDDPSGNVGRITSARLENGSLLVDWELHNTPAGWSSERFIESGIAPELSLQHAVYQDGSVKPIEVSLVRKGAREGCSISSKRYKLEGEKQANQVDLLMASVNATLPEAAVATPAPVAAVDMTPTETEPPAAAPAATGEEPAAKRKRFETPMDFVNDLQGRVSDPTTLQTILDYFGETMESNVQTQNEVTALRQAKELLEQSQKAHVESSKNVVRDIVDCLSAIYQNYGAVNMEAPHKEKLTNLLSENIEAREALRPILVAASAISRSVASASSFNAQAAVQAAAEKISMLSRKLSDNQAATRHLGIPTASASQAAVTPQWTGATPVVEIAASARSAPAESHKIIIPEILRSGPSYGEGGVGRVTRDQFIRKV